MPSPSNCRVCTAARPQLLALHKRVASPDNDFQNTERSWIPSYSCKMLSISLIPAVLAIGILFFSNASFAAAIVIVYVKISKEFYLVPKIFRLTFTLTRSEQLRRLRFHCCLCCFIDVGVKKQWHKYANVLHRYPLCAGAAPQCNHDCVGVCRGQRKEVGSQLPATRGILIIRSKWLCPANSLARDRRLPYVR